MLNSFRTLFVCLFSLYSCQARNDDAFELVSRLLCACLWLLISADKCCSFCTPFPAEVHPRRHFYVQTYILCIYAPCLHVSVCVLYLALVYFFVYGHPRGTRSFTSPSYCQFLLLPLFCGLLGCASCASCYMLPGPCRRLQDPVYARICCVFVCFCLLLIYGLVISLLCGIFCLLSTSHQRFVAVIKL